MANLRIEPAAPYSLERTTGQFARFPEEIVDRLHGSGFRRAFETPSGVTLLEATQQESNGHEAVVEIQTLQSTDRSAGDDSALTLARMLALDEPIEPVYELLSNHLQLRSLVDDLYGLRRTLDPTPFEGLASSIFAQLISIRGAAVVRSRFVQRFGSQINFDDNEYWTFPSPEAVHGATVDQLCGLGMTGAKARAIISVAERSLAGELSIDQLASMRNREIVTHLTSLPGIGPWTAEWFLINVMGRMSIVPSGDLGIRRSTGKWLLDGEMPSSSDVHRIYEPFGDYRGYIAYYILSAERHKLQPPLI